ncbi:CPBP family intramembrane glutamic endopeptidase [Anaerosinus massiliensis]|uniref:CPBP family intramembrane glutamic endopeptidase n=1 Tax=Massilibacillus massiliensis TaxID=1806837 RepID=UPI000DA5F03D|nr:CPBP family intramembrane glutamic endopeptidase [Massilibacillus massiliensis]
MKKLQCTTIHHASKQLFPLIVFILFIFTSWSIYILSLDGHIKNTFPFIYQILHIGLDKLLLMALPSYLYLTYFEKTNCLLFLKLNHKITTGLRYTILSILFLTLLAFHNQYQLLNYIKFTPKLSLYLWIDAILLAAIMDEIIFRGIILQTLASHMSFTKATFFSTCFFVFIHFPRWYNLGHFSDYTIIGNINFIFCFGILMGYILKKSNSLWPCILIHFVNNFISNALNL